MSPCATLVQYDGIIYSCVAGAGVLLRCAAGHAGQQSREAVPLLAEPRLLLTAA